MSEFQIREGKRSKGGVNNGPQAAPPLPPKPQGCSMEPVGYQASIIESLNRSEVFWRIRHKPSGMFYIPAKGSIYDKCNLSKTGKAYAKKPTLKHVGGSYYPHEPKREDGRLKVRKVKSSSPEDWEIVRYKVIEEGIE